MPDSRPVRVHAGTLVFGLGVVHQAIGLVFAREPLLAILDAGLIDAVGHDFDRQFGFWFVFAGFLTMLFGAALRALERGPGVPTAIAWGFAALTVLGVVALPLSPFPFLLVPAAMLIRDAANHPRISP